MSFVRRFYISILVLLVVAITSVGTLAAFAAVDPSMGLELAVADGLVEPAAPAPAEVAPQVPHSILAMILTAATPLLLAGLAWLGKRVDAWIAARTENELLEGFLLQLDHLVFSVVKELMQTLVPEYTKAAADGKLSPQEARHLKSVAIDTVMQRLGLKGQGKAAKLGIVGNVLLDMVGGRVEAALHDVKLERARAPHLNGKDLKAFATAVAGGVSGG